MSALRSHIALIDRLLLVEHNVINPNTIEAFVRKFVIRTRPEAGKTWFQKKLRSLIMNDARYLNALTADDIAMTKNLPDYVAQAAQRGEILYSFDPGGGETRSAINDLIQWMNHISDWFNSLAIVAGRPAATEVETEDKMIAGKWLEKLSRISITEVTEVADAWFAKMGTRIQSEKQGVEIVMQWENGYYAVRFTDLNTMKTDGADLQNCLQNGYYWDSVKKGNAAVYAIRKPNDEAVVGIRVAIGRNGISLQECKGKNNKAVSPAYVPYVVDFLNKMNFQVTENIDLKNAGIEIHNGKFGMFEDIADLVYHHEGIKIWQTVSRFVAQTPSTRFAGDIVNNSILKVEPSGETFPAEQTMLLKVLNILKLPPLVGLAKILNEQGIFFYDGQYGDARSVGKQMFTVDDYAGYQVSMKDSSNTEYSAVMIYHGDDYVGRLLITAGNKLGAIGDDLRRPFGVSLLDDNAPNPQFIAILNALAIPPLFETEKDLCKRFNVFFDKRYGALAEFGKIDITVGASSLVRLGKRAVWVVVRNGNRSGMRLWMKGKKLDYDSIASETDHATPDELKAVQQLALKYKVQAVHDAEVFGMLNTATGLVADLPSFLAAVKDTPEVAYVGSLGHGSQTPPGQALLQFARSMFANKLDKTQQQAVYSALKPSDQGVKIQTSATDMIFDIKVPHLTIELADANFYMRDLHVLSDKRLNAQIDRDAQTYLKNAFAQLSHVHHAVVDLNIRARLWQRYEAGWAALQERAQTIQQETRAAIREREQNPDKYATDLSSRFAALNAFRKR